VNGCKDQVVSSSNDKDKAPGGMDSVLDQTGTLDVIWRLTMICMSQIGITTRLPERGRNATTKYIRMKKVIM
jgi:hypothetical protein